MWTWEDFGLHLWDQKRQGKTWNLRLYPDVGYGTPTSLYTSPYGPVEREKERGTPGPLHTKQRVLRQSPKPDRPKTVSNRDDTTNHFIK